MYAIVLGSIVVWFSNLDSFDSLHKKTKLGEVFQRAQRSRTIACIGTNDESTNHKFDKQAKTHKHTHTHKEHNMNRTILPRKLNLRKWDIRILQFTIRFFFSRGGTKEKIKQILYTLPRLVSLFAMLSCTVRKKNTEKSVRLFSLVLAQWFAC